MARAIGLRTTLLGFVVIRLFSGCEALPTESRATLIERALSSGDEAISALKDGLKKNGYKGIADGLDGTLDGLYNGSPEHANDFVTVKWSKEWARGEEEGWTDSNGYPKAALKEKWDGTVDGGSGESRWQQSAWFEVGGCATSGPDLLILGAGCFDKGTAPLQSIAIEYLRIASESSDDVFFDTKLKPEKPTKPDKPVKPKKPKTPKTPEDIE